MEGQPNSLLTGLLRMGLKLLPAFSLLTVGPVDGPSEEMIFLTSLVTVNFLKNDSARLALVLVKR